MRLCPNELTFGGPSIVTGRRETRTDHSFSPDAFTIRHQGTIQNEVHGEGA
jgi:hypothetical protein